MSRLRASDHAQRRVVPVVQMAGQSRLTVPAKRPLISPVYLPQTFS
jgi:hypothetical protein